MTVPYDGYKSSHDVVDMHQLCLLDDCGSSNQDDSATGRPHISSDW